MWKPLSKNSHGFIDYAYALTLPLLAEMVGFNKNKTAKTLCRTLGAVALSYSLLTKARWGLIKILPFKTHLAIDLTISCFSITAPWLLGFSGDKDARNALIISGVLGLTATLLTDAEQQEDTEHHHLFI